MTHRKICKEIQKFYGQIGEGKTTNVAKQRETDTLASIFYSKLLRLDLDSSPVLYNIFYSKRYGLIDLNAII
jgi:hypothetical protein